MQVPFITAGILILMLPADKLQRKLIKTQKTFTPGVAVTKESVGLAIRLSGFALDHRVCIFYRRCTNIS